MCTTVTRQLHKLQSRQYACLPRTGGNMRQPSLPLCPLCGPSPPREIAPKSRPSRTKPRLCQRQPRQNHRPCCLPPPALHHYIWVQSSLPMVGGHSSPYSTSPTVAVPTSHSVVKEVGGDMRQPSLPLCPLCGPSPPREIAPISRPSRAKPRLCRRQPRQNHRPCCLPPPPYIIIFGRSPQYQRGGAFVAVFDVAYRGGSNITFRRQRGVGLEDVRQRQGGRWPHGGLASYGYNRQGDRQGHAAPGDG